MISYMFRFTNNNLATMFLGSWNGSYFMMPGNHTNTKEVCVCLVHDNFTTSKYQLNNFQTILHFFQKVSLNWKVLGCFWMKNRFTVTQSRNRTPNLLSSAQSQQRNIILRWCFETKEYSEKRIWFNVFILHIWMVLLYLDHSSGLVSVWWHQDWIHNISEVDPWTLTE